MPKVHLARSAIELTGGNPRRRAIRWPVTTVRLVLGCLVSAVLGCTTVRPTNLASGRPAYLVTCTSEPSGLAACFQRAGDLCGQAGFARYDWEGRRVAGRRYEIEAAEIPTEETKSILVACNGTVGP